MYTENENIILSESTRLCLNCGLCCKGYFHSNAIINNEVDLNLAKNMGATIAKNIDNTQYFQLPCPKFDEKCTVYPHRPSVCENHQCDLLKRLIEGKIGFKKAINISSEMKRLCIALDQELGTLNVGTLRKRFSTLFTSKNVTIREKNPKLLLTYASYQLLKNKYFYQEKSIYDENSSDQSL